MMSRKGTKVAAGRGDAKISASMIVRLTEITSMSPIAGL